jgi:4-hydroxyphenylpyruvate dioxygenase|tara:strand:- start:355 stop:471 length:117 start_codon:yes stop_codon:yes gene_type:complete
MKARGNEFLKIPDSYYDGLRKRLEASGTKVAEDLDTIQ